MKIQMSKTAPINQQNFDKIINFIKEFKKSIQKLEQKIYEKKKLQAENIIKIELNNIQTIDKIFSRIQESYLDPQSARKLLMLKQQYKSQKERFFLYQHQSKSQSGSRKYSGQNDRDKKASNVTYETEEEMIDDAMGFDYDLEMRLNREKSQTLKKVQQKMLTVHSLTLETQDQVYNQGGNLDIIGQKMQKSKANVKQSNEHLLQANKLQKNGQSKCFWLLLGVIMAIVIVFLIVFLI